MDDPLPPLDAAEVRVLGSLIEKQITTPDYYPLTLNALTNACNQLTNREPVVSLDDQTVVRALDKLRDKRLATLFTGAESRVAKYKHTLTDALLLTPGEVALLCVLMLRGPQTLGAALHAVSRQRHQGKAGRRARERAAGRRSGGSDRAARPPAGAGRRVRRCRV